MKFKAYKKFMALLMTGAIAATGVPVTALAAEDVAVEASFQSEEEASGKAEESFSSSVSQEEPFEAEDFAEVLAEEAAVQEGTCGENVTWKLSEDGELRISGSGEMTDYSVADASPWSELVDSIKTVVIEDGVTSIGDRAFRRCMQMTEISIPDSVTSIGKNAFDYCISLGEISIPDGVTSIGSEAFSMCRVLESIQLPASLKEISTSMFMSCSALKECVIPDGVEKIGSQAFYGAKLEKVTIPASVNTIEVYAFGQCPLMDVVMGGDAPASTDTNAFYNCPDDMIVSVPARAEGYFEDPWLYMDVQFREEHVDELNAIRAALLDQAKSDNAFWDLLNRVNAGETLSEEEKADACARAVEMATAPYLDTSELAMAAIAINAMGLDASQVTSGEKTVDLIALMSVRVYQNLVAYHPEDEMGSELEDWTLALAAYDSGNHELPANAVWTRDKIIKHILDSQDEKGGWHFFDKNTFDWHPYATAQTMLVLAPYYTENDEVREAVDTSMKLISEKFKSTGKLFVTVVGEEEDPADVAMVIAALRAYGIDVNADEDYIYKEDPETEMTLVDYLLTFKQEDNTFGPNTNEIPYCPKGASGLQAIISLGSYDGYLPYQTNCPDEAQASPHADGYEIPKNATNSVNPDGPLGVFAQHEDINLNLGETGKASYRLISGSEDMIESIHWESRDESVATVDDEGNVKAVGEGSTSLKLTVVAKGGGQSFSSVNVTVTKPSDEAKAAFQNAKVDVTAKSVGYDSVKLTWKALDNADSYLVYRKVKGGHFTRIATVTDLNYTDETAKTGTTYYYTVKAASNRWGGTIYSKYVTNLMAKAVPAKASISKTQTWGYNGIKVTWDKVAGADGYRLYYKTGNSGWKYATQTGNTSYVHTRVTTGQNYTYYVRAYCNVDGTKVFGAYSQGKTGKAVPKKAVITKATAGSKKVSLNWNKVNGASGYRIYYKTSENGKWHYVTQIGKGSTTSYTNTGLKSGQTYYYTMRAYRTVNGEKVFGSYSDWKTVKVK